MTELLIKIKETLEGGNFAISDQGIIVDDVLVYAEIVEFIQQA